MNFESNLIFLIKPFFLHAQKVKKEQKEQKELLRWIKKRFWRAIIEKKNKKNVWKVRDWL